MKDVQNSPDHRNIPLDEVGVTSLRYPVTILDRENREQSTVAEITMSVDLPRHFKGTHMSRFIEVLTESGCAFTGSTIPGLLARLMDSLEAGAASIRIEFPYFMEKKAPVTGASALMSCTCSFTGTAGPQGDDFMLSVTAPVGTLCPCSREISDQGAHNQRGYVTMEVSTLRTEDGGFEMLWIEELVEIAERAASSPLYTILKRSDEKHVTEMAYSNPVFVEDLVRSVSQELMADPRVRRFTVKAENHESIHTHNAYAVVRWSRPC